jgi:hypothetical protein
MAYIEHTPGVGLTKLLGSSSTGVVVLPSHPNSVFQSARGDIIAGDPRTPLARDNATIEEKRIMGQAEDARIQMRGEDKC